MRRGEGGEEEEEEEKEVSGGEGGGIGRKEDAVLEVVASVLIFLEYPAKPRN
jgi:hypothetical protein